MKKRPIGGAHEALEALMEEVGGGDSWEGKRRAAELCEVRPTTFLHLLDPDHPTGQLSFARVSLITRHFGAPAAAAHLAHACGHEVRPRQRRDMANTPPNALAHAAKEMSEAMAQICALLPGENERLTDGQRRQAIREITEGIEAGWAVIDELIGGRM